MKTLFTPLTAGSTELSNRVVMAPMTRSRARSGDTADEQTALYYAQRASAGLIITEGSQISVQGQGYLFTPGIYSQQQISGWQLTTQAVHEKGGKIFLQLWHVGRISHQSLQREGAAPVSSVALRAQNSNCYAIDERGQPGQIPTSKPEALSIEGIRAIIDDYVAAAQNAMAAGFDGVEIHAANGYLLEQFINAGLNTRKDEYGGADYASRVRFTLEVTDAISAAIGSDKTGIRLAPFGRLFDMHAFDGEEQTWLHLAAELNTRKLAYVHLSDQQTLGQQAIPDGFLPKFRRAWQGVLIIAGGFDSVLAEQYLQAGYADLIGFGRPYIANPDLVERMANNWPLVEPDRATFYGGSAVGYTDYPAYHSPSQQQG